MKLLTSTIVDDSFVYTELKGLYMEQINNVELKDPTIYPDSIVLKRLLGESYVVYEAFQRLYRSMDMEYEWRYYKDGKAWLCKVQKKKKTIVWMSAWKDYMQATVYIPDKHVAELKGLELKEDVKARILAVKRVGKSVPCMFELRTMDVLDEIEKVMMLKISLY